MTVELHEHAQAVRRAIASFQALRHRIADVKMQLELGRSMSHFASLARRGPRRRGAAPSRRRRCSSASRCASSASSASSCTAASASPTRYAASHYFKRLTVLEMSFGDTLHHLGEGRRPHAGHRPACLPECRRLIHRRRGRPSRRPFHRRAPAHRLHGRADPQGVVCVDVDVRGGGARHARDRPAAPPTVGRCMPCCSPAAAPSGSMRRRRDALAGERGHGVSVRPGARAHRAGGGALRPVGRRCPDPARRRAPVTPPARRQHRPPAQGQRRRRGRRAWQALTVIGRAMKGGIGSASLRAAGITVARAGGGERHGDVIDAAAGPSPARATGRRLALPTMRAIPAGELPAFQPGVHDDRRGRHRCRLTKAQANGSRRWRTTACRAPSTRCTPWATATRCSLATGAATAALISALIGALAGGHGARGAERGARGRPARRARLCPNCLAPSGLRMTLLRHHPPPDRPPCCSRPLPRGSRCAWKPWPRSCRPRRRRARPSSSCTATATTALWMTTLWRLRATLAARTPAARDRPALPLGAMPTTVRSPAVPRARGAASSPPRSTPCCNAAASQVVLVGNLARRHRHPQLCGRRRAQGVARDPGGAPNHVAWSSASFRPTSEFNSAGAAPHAAEIPTRAARASRSRRGRSG